MPGDINGDGIVDIAISASGDDDSGWDNGAIYIFFMNSTLGVEEDAKIVQLGFTATWYGVSHVNSM